MSVCVFALPYCSAHETTANYNNELREARDAQKWTLSTFTDTKWSDLDRVYTVTLAWNDLFSHFSSLNRAHYSFLCYLWEKSELNEAVSIRDLVMVKEEQRDSYWSQKQR